jgi:hypothetical protein
MRNRGKNAVANNTAGGMWAVSGPVSPVGYRFKTAALRGLP